MGFYKYNQKNQTLYSRNPLKTNFSDVFASSRMSGNELLIIHSAKPTHTRKDRASGQNGKQKSRLPLIPLRDSPPLPGPGDVKHWDHFQVAGPDRYRYQACNRINLFHTANECTAMKTLCH